jgi:type III pantothenate kinase
MNLIIDIGNSSTKVAIFDHGKNISQFRIRDLTCAEMEKRLPGTRIDRAIISSVRLLPPFIHDLLFINIPEVHVLSYKSRLPFKIEYETPETLGTDRIAAVAGAFQVFPGEEVLLIDAGTAITYDFLAGDVYKGGNISPGINMRLRALNKFTGKLPLVKMDTEFSFPGKNTTDAILAGVIGGVSFEINEYIRTFKKQHKNIKIIMTGGDGSFIKGKISHKVNYMPDIVIDGLNFILEYNA